MTTEDTDPRGRGATKKTESSDKPAVAYCNGLVKRSFDLLLAVCLCAVLFVPLALIALILWFRWGRCPIFTQTRIGRGGESFTLFKLRTLPPDFPRETRKPPQDLVRQESPMAAFWRRFGIDEMPQLLNVVRGDMSLVGPRPEMPSIVRGYDARCRRRLDVRPGITGIWQIAGDLDRPIHNQIHYDLFYLRRASLLFDFWICHQTIRVIIVGRSLDSRISRRGRRRRRLPPSRIPD